MLVSRRMVVLTIFTPGVHQNHGADGVLLLAQPWPW